VPGIVAASLDSLLSRPKITACKQSFLNIAGSDRAQLAKNQREQLNEIITNFPREIFLKEYPFLSEYL
jgi:hypothetical protein